MEKIKTENDLLPHHIYYNDCVEMISAALGKRTGKEFERTKIENYQNLSVYLGHEYTPFPYFLKTDVAKMEDGFEWIAKKLGITRNRKSVCDYFGLKYEQYVQDEWRKFSIPGKTFKEYNSDDWGVWSTYRVNIYVRCREGVLSEINRLLIDWEIEDEYKRLVYAVLYYEVGHKIQDLEGD